MEISLQIPHYLLKDGLVGLKAIDALYLGELYCPRRESPMDELVSLIEKIRARGKRVYLSTPVLATSNKILSRIRDYFQMAKEGLIDGVSVNDLGALRLGISEYPEISLYSGPYLEVRNVACAKVLANLGVERFSLPYDLPREEIKEIISKIKIKAEVFVQGKIPLLVSKRCFLMRAKGMAENSPCHTLCLNQFKEGMRIAPCGSEEPLFELKGRVVYSTKEYSLLEDLDQIKELGVAGIRVEENEQLRPNIYRAYRHALNGKPNYQLPVTSDQLANGFFFGQAGLLYVGRDRHQVSGIRDRVSEETQSPITNHRSLITDHHVRGRFFEELSNLAREVGHNQKLIEKLEGIEGDILFEVTDTGERCSLGVREGRTYGPIAGEPEKPPVLRVRAKEEIYLGIIQGRIDPDAAYLLRKIRFKGPFLAAVKLKHILGAIR